MGIDDFYYSYDAGIVTDVGWTEAARESARKSKARKGLHGPIERARQRYEEKWAAWERSLAKDPHNAPSQYGATGFTLTHKETGAVTGPYMSVTEVPHGIDWNKHTLKVRATP